MAQPWVRLLLQVLIGQWNACRPSTTYYIDVASSDDQYLPGRQERRINKKSARLSGIYVVEFLFIYLFLFFSQQSYLVNISHLSPFKSGQSHASSHQARAPGRLQATKKNNFNQLRPGRLAWAAC